MAWLGEARLPTRQRPPKASLRGPLVYPAPAGRAPGSGQQLLQQHGPADQGIAALADTALYRQVEIAGFVDQVRDFAGGLGDIQDQHAASARDIVMVGHEASPRVPWGRPACSGAAPLTWSGQGAGRTPSAATRLATEQGETAGDSGPARARTGTGAWPLTRMGSDSGERP
jgi:hypothetical protein